VVTKRGWTFNWAQPMNKYLGDTVTVVGKKSKDYFQIEEDDGKWHWHKDWLTRIEIPVAEEPVKEEKKPEVGVRILKSCTVPSEHVERFWKEYDDWSGTHIDKLEDFHFWNYVKSIVPGIDGDMHSWDIDDSNILEPKLIKTDRKG